MVKYYCNKCGNEITKGLLKVVTADTKGDKKNYHLCATCTKEFIEFMQGTTESIDTYEEKVCEDTVSKGPPGLVENTVEEFINGNDSDLSKSDCVTTEEASMLCTGSNDDGNKNTVKSKRGKFITEDIKKYISDNMKSKSAKELADELDIPYSSVYQCIRNIRKTYGEINVKSTDSISENDAGRCVALYRAGWSIQNIADEIGEDDVNNVVEALRINGALRGK